MQIPRLVLNQTALTGVLVCGLTLRIHQEKGKQPSRAYANVTREAATYSKALGLTLLKGAKVNLTMHPWPIENAAITVRERAARAVF